MTGSLTHTAPVPLPAMQESGSAPVRGTEAPPAQQVPAGTSASAAIPRNTAPATASTHNTDTTTAAHPAAANPAAASRRTNTSAAGPGDTGRVAAVSPTQATDLPVTRAADTLSVQGADSLAADSLSCQMPGDSILFFSLEYPARNAADTLWRDVPAAEVFGTASEVASPRSLRGAPAPSLTENPVFQGFVLLLAATYAMLLYRNLGDIRLLLTRVSHDTATGRRLMEDPGGSGFSRFLNIATAIGILFVGVITVKYGDSLIPDSFIETIPQGAVLGLSLLATLACIGIALFQLAAVRLTGAVTLSQPFISQLVLLRRTYFTLGTIVTVPFLLLFALCPRGTGGVWFCIIVIQLVATAFLYLRETLNLFISKKISILHWILYLCTVEVFPFSLIWLLAAR